MSLSKHRLRNNNNRSKKYTLALSFNKHSKEMFSFLSAWRSHRKMTIVHSSLSKNISNCHQNHLRRWYFGFAKQSSLRFWVFIEQNVKWVSLNAHLCLQKSEKKRRNSENNDECRVKTAMNVGSIQLMCDIKKGRKMANGK